MSALLVQIQNLAARGEVEFSQHAFKELIADDISIQDVLRSLPAAEAIEEHPDYFKGPVNIDAAKRRRGEADPSALGRSCGSIETSRARHSL